jgi:hypothetical protein
MMTDKQLREIEGAIMGRPKKEQTEEIVKDKGIYFTTGITLLDLVVGGGVKAGFGMGYPSGTIVRDWGDSSSSKTYKACHFIAANYYKYKDKLKWCYQDVEHGNTIDTKTLYGFDLMGESFKGPKEVKTVEDWEYDVFKFLEYLKPDEYGIYILDSLDFLSDVATEARKDERHALYDKGKEVETGSFNMSNPKFLSQEMYRGLSAELDKKKVLLYIISQARDNINAGMWAPKDRVNGGRATRFAESVRIKSVAHAKEETSGRATCIEVGTIAEKTRHTRPFRSCMFPVIFDWGLDDAGANIDFLFDLRSDKTGELLGRADAVCWEEAEPVTLDSLTDFLKENNVFDACSQKLAKKFNVKNIKKWIEDIGNLTEAFEAKFGKTITRTELVDYVLANKLQKELRQRVIDKWEAIEASIATHRPRQFSDIEE